MIKWEGIMIHHSLTKDSKTVSWSAIRSFHTEHHGWKDIGYHAGIEKVGGGLSPRNYEVLTGRPLYMNGAHCPQGGANRRFLGFCFIGNFDNEAEAKELENEALLHAAKYWIVPMLMYSVQAEFVEDRPWKKVLPMHRDYNPAKSCPGTEFPIRRLRDIVEKMYEAEMGS